MVDYTPPRRLIIPRADNAQVTTTVLFEGELIYNPSAKTIHVGNGSTPGGTSFKTTAQVDAILTQINAAAQAAETARAAAVAATSGKVNKAGDVMSGPLYMDGHRVEGVAPPDSDDDAARLADVNAARDYAATIVNDEAYNRNIQIAASIIDVEERTAEYLTTAINTEQQDRNNQIQTSIDLNVPYRSILTCYPNPGANDSDAIATAFATNAGGSLTLAFIPGKGKGPGGDYVIDRLLEFVSNGRLVIEGNGCTFRYVVGGACIRHTMPMLPEGSAGNFPGDFFAIRNVVCKAAAAGVIAPIHWNCGYMASRILSTGYAENVRFQPLDVASPQYFLNHFRCSNTWQWSATRCYAEGKPNIPSAIIPDSTFVELQGTCIVTTIDKCEVDFIDKAVVVGFTNLMPFNAVITSGSYIEGARVTQPSTGATGIFYRHAGYLGHDYCLGQVQGVFQSGPAVIENIGTMDIHEISPILAQPSEAIHIVNSTAFVHCNYGIYANMPSSVQDRKCVHVTLDESTHISFYKAGLYLRYCAAVESKSSIHPEAIGAITYDLDQCLLVQLNNNNSPTNGRTNCTFVKASNTLGLTVMGNALLGYETPWDFASTVTDANVQGNTGIACGVPVSAAAAFTSDNLSGVRFHNNGRIGVGFDYEPSGNPDNPTYLTDG